jgi:hypothetical protein
MARTGVIPCAIHRFAADVAARIQVKLWVVQGNAAISTLLFLAVWRPSHDGVAFRQRGTVMELTLLGVIIGLAVAVTVLVWIWRAGRLNGASPEARYRNDIRALKHRPRQSTAARQSTDIWSAGATPGSAHSKTQQATAWAAMGAIGGCGGCSGCGGCGGCGG